MSLAPGDPETRPARPWQARLALIWAVGFAILYARSVIVDRFPALAAWLRGH